jgi:acyl-CoA thioester hydrolase
VRLARQPSMDAIFQSEIKVTEAVVDGNGHVNNVAYVQWMQDVAIGHSEATGCTAQTTALGATWVARSHHIEYLRPARAGETITALTWVAGFRKVRSLRKYKFIRGGDGAVLAQAETDWVFIDARTGRARAIPEIIQRAFRIVAPAEEP